jgi:hypothetical protein
VRFVDARLEQAGYIPVPVPRDVIRGELGYMEYHMPSMGDVLFEACRGVQREAGSVVLAGTVVDGLGRVVPQATVRVSWTGFFQAGGGWVNTDNPNGLTQTTEGFETSTSSTGFFQFCGVPPETALKLYAAIGDGESEEHTVTISEFDTGALRVLQIEGH